LLFLALDRVGGCSQKPLIVFIAEILLQLLEVARALPAVEKARADALVVPLVRA
jgi:hypothetical protein